MSTITKDQALEACPFCGGAAWIESNRDTHKLFANHDAECIRSDGDPDVTAPATDYALAALIAAWNRRTHLPQDDSKQQAEDARRYRWLKMESPPNQPTELFAKMMQAKRLIEAYEVFCKPWTEWDAAIDAALGSSQEGQ